MRQHFAALKQAGYVTISQQDIIDYYEFGKPLPEKALFLIFEDARRNTAIFAQKVLEESNFKATMLSFPERFELKDQRFLTPDEFADLETTTFWELGTNGYRYAFINVFDRYDNFFPKLNLFEHTILSPYLDLHLPIPRQSHYLMDYIRRADGTYQESNQELTERISSNYKDLYDVYADTVKAKPALHALLGPNPGRFGQIDEDGHPTNSFKFGENKDTDALNEYWIKNLFKININRTDTSVNKPGNNIYDLTRIQPQAWWSVNHLLARLKYDLEEEGLEHNNIEYVTGDPVKFDKWQLIRGAAEFRDKSIVATSFPRDISLLKLKESDHFKDVYVDVILKGNRLGHQKIYLRSDPILNKFTAVCILDNHLYITEKTDGAEKLLFKLNLDRHDGIPQESVHEDEKRAEIGALSAFMYSAPRNSKKAFEEEIKNKENELKIVAKIADGALEYVPIVTIYERGDRKLNISLIGNQISVSIDEKEAVANLPLTSDLPGAVYIETGWRGNYFTDETPDDIFRRDKVYDGVFEDFLITENTGKAIDKELVLFNIRPQGIDALMLKIYLIWDKIVEFLITDK
jgi:hypothetical protein